MGSFKSWSSPKKFKEFEELKQNFTAECSDENEVKDEAYLLILPKLRKDLQNIYLERLLWTRQLKRDPIHKKIMETRVFVNDDNLDHWEALEAAIDKRNLSWKDRNTRYPSDIYLFI
jgi:hypothetical protein